MSISFWPAWITPPTVCTARPTTWPVGRRLDVDAGQIVRQCAELAFVGLHFTRHLGELGFDFLAIFLLPAIIALAQFADGALAARVMLPSSSRLDAFASATMRSSSSWRLRGA